MTPPSASPVLLVIIGRVLVNPWKTKLPHDVA